MRRELYEKDCGVYNRGICGDTTEDILRRFDIEVSSIEPDLILIAVGINDSKFPNGGSENKVPFERFQGNINTLVVKATEKAQKVVLIGLTEVNEAIINEVPIGSSSSVFKNEVIQKYDAHLEALAEKEGVAFVSMKKTLDTTSDLMDGLHPNAAGYEKMFKAILPHIGD